MNSSIRRIVLTAGLVLSVGMLAYPSVAQAGIVYKMTLDTSPLIGHVAGPNTLEFQLTDGDSASNSITVSSFDFGGGSAAGAPILVGGASGDLASQVDLQDTDFLNQFIQPFVPGSFLEFLVDLTTNSDGGFFPDQFSFAILDSTGAELPTEGLGDAIVTIDLVPPFPPAGAFGGDSGRSPVAGGDPIAFDAPTIAAVPEPATLGLALSAIAIGVGPLAVRFAKRRVKL
jgi:hypothetical protein